MSSNFKLVTNINAFSTIQYTGTQASGEEILQFLYTRNVEGQVVTNKRTELQAGKVVNEFQKYIYIQDLGVLNQFDYLLINRFNQLEIVPGAEFSSNYAEVPETAPKTR